MATAGVVPAGTTPGMSWGGAHFLAASLARLSMDFITARRMACLRAFCCSSARAEAATLSEAFEDYFRQSEQLPTRLLLVADGERAAGLILQKLPGDEGDGDGWNRAGALFDTLRSDELLALPGSQLLHRLFHEEAVQILAERPLRFACSCSRDRVAAMLHSLGEDEARAALADGQADVRCEFCGQRYLFSGPQIEELFALSGVGVQAPERLQ